MFRGIYKLYPKLFSLKTKKLPSAAFINDKSLSDCCWIEVRSLKFDFLKAGFYGVAGFLVGFL